MLDKDNVLFPLGLFSWAGHRSGGVKKPFVGSSGLPAGEIIRTNLLDKIDNWIDSLVQNNSSTARALLMVGGPGNGKTEAVEYLVKKLDKKLDVSQIIVERCKEKFTYAPGVLPEMKEVIHIGDLDLPKNFNFNRIEIVHDASVGDPSDLISDLERVNREKDFIYIACINRGILSQILSIVANPNKYNNNIINMFEQIQHSVTLGPEQQPCWPLSGYSHVNLWPMDIESLVDQAIYKEKPPVYHIFKKALDISRWINQDECPAGELCPFHANLQLLSQEENLANLIGILKYYELASGKRWTFRELYSLVPQLLVGHENDFEVRGQEIDPCSWAALKVKIIGSSHVPYEIAKARFLLCSKIYYHALFPRWPGRGVIKDHQKKLLKPDRNNRYNAHDLFRLLAWHKRGGFTSTNELLTEQVGPTLDPAEASGDTDLQNSGLTVDKLEEMFSYSVKQGYEAIIDFLSVPEREFMKWLVEIEERLVMDASRGNKNYVKYYEEIRKTIQITSCRMAKRSLAVKSGITKDFNYLEKYNHTIKDERKLKEARKIFDGLINESSQFPVSLTTTFGQAIPKQQDDAVLLAGRLKTSYKMPPKSNQHAQSLLPYLMVQKHSIPLTYDLFKALIELNEGLMKASFPADTLALIEGTKSLMAGKVVRDMIDLDDAILKIGNMDYSIETLNEQILIEEK